MARTSERTERMWVPDGITDDWKKDGLCFATAPPGEKETPFFPHNEQSNDGTKYRQAKAMCDACPVVDACLEYAVATRQEYGMWGGLTPRQRKSRRHGRRRTAA